MVVNVMEYAESVGGDHRRRCRCGCACGRARGSDGTSELTDENTEARITTLPYFVQLLCVKTNPTFSSLKIFLAVPSTV